MGRKKKSDHSKVELNLTSVEEPAREVSQEVEALSSNEDAVTDDESATGTFVKAELEKKEGVEEKAPRRRRSKKEDENVSTSATNNGAEPERNALVKHWETVRDITDSITRNFERISQQLQEISIHAPQAPTIVERHASPKVTLLNRVTLAASAASVVLGLVSLSLSQSVREQMLKSHSNVLEPSGARATMFEPISQKDDAPPTPIDSLSKKPSELSRKQKDLWRLRQGH